MARYLARSGLRIPMPGQPGRYIPEDGDGVCVNEQDSYFRRLIDDGDLIVDDTAVAVPAEPKGRK